jgi:hypothetical protein
MWVGLKRAIIGLLPVGAGVMLSCGFFMFWVTQYPTDYDPKNIDYVLWTHRLNQNMNLDDALEGMTHDTWAFGSFGDRAGSNIRSRFGYIRELREATPYLQLCNTPPATGQLGVHPQGREVVFLRDSPWMVILDHGKAVDLVLCKGY